MEEIRDNEKTLKKLSEIVSECEQAWYVHCQPIVIIPNSSNYILKRLDNELAKKEISRMFDNSKHIEKLDNIYYVDLRENKIEDDMYEKDFLGGK